MVKEGVYCIENPLIDVLVNVSESDLQKLKLNKGIMHLIDEKRRSVLLKFIHSKDKTFLCGGSGPNTTTSLSSLGIKSTFSGKVGNDDYGKMYELQLKKRKVISKLKHGHGKTGSCIILITPDTERTMNTFLGMCRRYGKKDVDEECIKDAEFLYFTGYMWDTDSQKKAILYAMELARKHGTKIAFDVADPFCVSRNKDEFKRIIANSDIVFANKEEAKILFDMDDPKEAVKHLSDRCETGIVKIGKDGALIGHNGKIIRVKGRKVKAIDTTGAGDCFAAGFIYGLCSNYDLTKAGVFASYLASEIVTQKGAQFLDEKLKKIRKDIKSGAWDYTK